MNSLDFIYGRIKSYSKYIKPKEIRIGLITALLLYSSFGILDLFMLQENYQKAWIIRFVFIFPILVIFYFLSYLKLFHTYSKLILFLLLTGGQIGIVLMIFFSEPHEEAFFGYYAGLQLVILWSGFVFRFSFLVTSIMFVSVLFSYDFVAIFFQKLPQNGIDSKEFAWFLGNNFFLISSGILTMMGSFHLNKSKQEIENENKKYRLAKEKAESSDKLKSEFLSQMSHEIRTPVNTLINFSEILIDDHMEDQEFIDEIKNGIKVSGKRIIRTINLILLSSELQNNTYNFNAKKIFLCKDILGKIYDEYSSIISEKDIEFIYFCSTEVEINGDEFSIYQIVDNLIDNAVKFTVSGIIKIDLSLDNGIPLLTIEDTGIGMSEEYLTKIFQPFSQEDKGYSRKYDGVGLGLNLVKKFCELNSIDISIESEKEKGTKVFLLFRENLNTP